MAFADEMRLFDAFGQRLYIDATERLQFAKAVKQVDVPKHRLFAEVLYWTGCRLMEAAELTPNRIHVEDKAILFRTLKRRKTDNQGKSHKPHYRAVPVPCELIESLDLVFKVRHAQRSGDAEKINRLFWPNKNDARAPMARATAWRIIKRVMDSASISGPQATAKGLRHSFGVAMTLAGIDVFKLRDLLGHVSAETTQVYRQATGKDVHSYVMSAWDNR